MTSKEKAADEKFCTSCGESIKKKAEICPNCGIPNNKQSSSTATKPTTSTSASNQSTHDPSNYETNVSNSWWYGVAASVVFWIIGFIPPEGSPVAGFFFLIAWVLMPLSIYFDRQWVQATTKWKPDQNLWLILSVLPLVNIVAGSVYVYRRYNSEQISLPNSTDIDRADNSPEDAAVQELRERYANGELTDAEFEQKVEKVIATEQADDAEAYIDHNEQ